MNEVKAFEDGSRWLLLAPVHIEKGRTLDEKLGVLLQQGFARVLVDNETHVLTNLQVPTLPIKKYCL